MKKLLVFGLVAAVAVAGAMYAVADSYKTRVEPDYSVCNTVRDSAGLIMGLRASGMSMIGALQFVKEGNSSGQQDVQRMFNKLVFEAYSFSVVNESLFSTKMHLKCLDAIDVNGRYL